MQKLEVFQSLWGIEQRTPGKPVAFRRRQGVSITDDEQCELSDRWEESLQIRQWARDIWTEPDADE